MTKQELFKYELPWFADYISAPFLQKALAWYYAKKVNRKYDRYIFRVKRQKFFESLSKLSNL